MTHALYFGTPAFCPHLQPAPPDDTLLSNLKINIISFDPTLLLSQKISLEGSRKNSSQDYAEFMKMIDFPTLRFKKVQCGFKSMFILDSKNEMWCLGACDAGQLGISNSI